MTTNFLLNLDYAVMVEIAGSTLHLVCIPTFDSIDQFCHSYVALTDFQVEVTDELYQAATVTAGEFGHRETCEHCRAVHT